MAPFDLTLFDASDDDLSPIGFDLITQAEALIVDASRYLDNRRNGRPPQDDEILFGGIVPLKLHREPRILEWDRGEPGVAAKPDRAQQAFFRMEFVSEASDSVKGGKTYLTFTEWPRRNRWYEMAPFKGGLHDERKRPLVWAKDFLGALGFVEGQTFEWWRGQDVTAALDMPKVNQNPRRRHIHSGALGLLGLCAVPPLELAARLAEQPWARKMREVVQKGFFKRINLEIERLHPEVETHFQELLNDACYQALQGPEKELAKAKGEPVSDLAWKILNDHIDNLNRRLQSPEATHPKKDKDLEEEIRQAQAEQKQLLRQNFMKPRSPADGPNRSPIGP